MRTVPDNKIETIWKCDECGEECSVNPDFFQDNGTPMCTECDCDMSYLRTDVHDDCFKVVDATYVSVWDGRTFESKARVNLGTKEVEILEVHEDDGTLDVLEDEYILMDGEQHPVCNKDNIEEGENPYWYE